jgi:hypothetical protein
MMPGRGWTGHRACDGLLSNAIVSYPRQSATAAPEDARALAAGAVDLIGRRRRGEGMGQALSFDDQAGVAREGDHARSRQAAGLAGARIRPAAGRVPDATVRSHCDRCIDGGGCGGPILSIARSSSILLVIHLGNLTSHTGELAQRRPAVPVTEARMASRPPRGAQVVAPVDRHLIVQGSRCASPPGGTEPLPPVHRCPVPIHCT